MSSVADFLDRFLKLKRFNLVAFVVISALVLIAYSNTFTASFHFDDNPSIIENASIRHVTADNIASILKGVRPVVYLSIMLNYQIGGLDVVGYHIFNVGVHVANSCFLYLLILWTLGLPQFSQHYANKARLLALFGALLFAVHPIQTESVTYIISRTELLATFFYLSAILFFIRAVVTGRFAYVIGVLVASAFAMGSKEWAVTLPVMLVMYDFFFFAEGRLRPLVSRWHIYVLATLPSWIAVHNLDLFSRGGQAGIGFNIVDTRGLTPTTYFLTSLNVLWTYIRLLLLPVQQNLDYDYPIAKTLIELPTLLSLLGHVAVAAAAWWLYKKKNLSLIPFGIAWFYLGIAPVQSIVPVVDVIFEHRVYMPSIGFFLVFVLAYDHVFDWVRERFSGSAVKPSARAKT